MNNGVTNRFLLAFSLFCVALAQPAQAMQLTFACEDKQDFPIVMGNSDKVLDSNPGLGIEAVYLLEKILGFNAVIVRLPWMRCLHDLQQGKIDVLFTASFKEERRKYGRFPDKDGEIDVSRRFTSASYVLYRLKESDVDFDGSTFINITGKVGAPRGYSVVEILRNSGLSVDESPGTKNDFLKLIGGRIQAAAALEMTGDTYLQSEEKFESRIEKILPPIAVKNYYFMISHQFYRKNGRLAEKIFDTIAEIRENPDFKNRLKNYLQ